LFLSYLLQLCVGAFALLHGQNLFLILQTYLTRNQVDAPLTKPAPTPAVAKKKSYVNKLVHHDLGVVAPMDAREILDTMLGHLGFVVDIQEIETEDR